MFWLKSMILTIQMAAMVGLCGVSSDAEELVDNFNLEAIYDADVVSDFLSMDAEMFEKQYDKKALYKRDILYCTEEAWRFQGVAQPAYDGTVSYYLDDIRAIRFTNIWPQNTVIYEETILYNQYNLIRYFGDYAVSMYFQESRDEESGEERIRLIEFSFLKIRLSEQDRGEVGVEDIYKNQEYDYYEGWRKLNRAEWKESPEGTKAVYIVNAIAHNAPSQIYVRYQEKIPDLIFREQWEYLFGGWIDEEHFICYNDGGLYIVHIETNQIEEIVTTSTQEGNFETWGCQYEIGGNQIIATCIHDDCYYWDIVREDGEILLIKAEEHD